MKILEERRGGNRAIILMVLANIATGIWWASGLTTEVKNQTKAIEALQVAQYTKDEARSDFRNVELQVIEVTRRVGALEERPQKPSR